MCRGCAVRMDRWLVEQADGTHSTVRLHGTPRCEVYEAQQCRRQVARAHRHVPRRRHGVRRGARRCRARRLRYNRIILAMPVPRLFVIMAPSSRLAVVLRRGPSAWTQLISWNTGSDEFTPGAWFRGRIYEEKCDLSPDGQLFVYAAFQGGRLGTSYTDSWTAVSRPPWLHALMLWPMGTTYGGGGRFVDNRRLVLRGAGKAHHEHPLRGIEVVPGTAEYQRSTEEVEGVDWSGRDHGNRLVFAKNGRIFARTGGHDVELVDLSPYRPDPQPAPEWATRPLPELPSAQRRRSAQRLR